MARGGNATVLAVSARSCQRLGNTMRSARTAYKCPRLRRSGVRKASARPEKRNVGGNVVRRARVESSVFSCAVGPKPGGEETELKGSGLV